MFRPADMLSLVPGLAPGQTHRAEEVDGFFAADSTVRRLHRERLVLFSGMRALLMQACDPLGLPPDSMPATHAGLKRYIDGRLGDGSLWISGQRREQAVRMILEPPYSGWLRLAVTPVTETVRLTSLGLLPPRIRSLFGFSWDPGREALLRSTLLQLRVGTRFWPDAVRLHPAARLAAGERYGALAA